MSRLNREESSGICESRGTSDDTPGNVKHLIVASNKPLVVFCLIVKLSGTFSTNLQDSLRALLHVARASNSEKKLVEGGGKREREV